MNTRSGRSGRRVGQRVWSAAYTALCLIIIGAGAIAVWDSRRFSALFPVVFFAAAALNILSGTIRLRHMARTEKKAPSVGQIALGVLLFVIGVISLITLLSGR